MGETLLRCTNPIGEPRLCLPNFPVARKTGTAHGSLGAVSRDRRYTRRTTFWSISSPSCFSLQPLRALSRWAIWYCFAELLGDTSTAPFHHQLDLSLQGSAHWNKRRSPGRSATRQLGSAILRP
uniref:Uncharacterized protein n=1 Tax=Solanum tuberosum TaxID=4113 RepID=M1D9M8_SOLTU